ncbi:hypothetical protein PPERSA_05485 [Pseudocohnilembus persalinus]|uniref:Insulin-like growth factor binding protein, N-terminal n=1 Tax=Pseudocohnilembus persalinus TaxID=266149 RepID=A0A0V0QCN1_PSEPJ|nr:hypothetical protein PPERSA_05485 [Pseudocohnilembus persalinus]|eukprot:KRW99982.1 hypothetical protein PPERSA_05485 [Pseudocohnilembus persalinus]
MNLIISQTFTNTSYTASQKFCITGCDQHFLKQNQLNLYHYCDKCHQIEKYDYLNLDDYFVCLECKGSDLILPDCKCNEFEFPQKKDTDGKYECLSCEFGKEYFNITEFNQCYLQGNCKYENICIKCEDTFGENCLSCRLHEYIDEVSGSSDYIPLCTVCKGYLIEPYCQSCSLLKGTGYFYNIELDHCTLDQNNTIIDYNSCISEQRKKDLPMCQSCVDYFDNKYCTTCIDRFDIDLDSVCTKCQSNRIPPTCQCNFKMVPDPKSPTDCIMCKSDEYYDYEKDDCRISLGLNNKFDCNYEDICTPCSDIYRYCINCDKDQEDQRLKCFKCNGNLSVKPDNGQNPVICWCPPKYYRFSNETNICEECPDHATCEGEFIMAIEPGYWRENTQTAAIFECVNNKDVCLGGYSNFTCMEGYVGALCQECDINGDYWGKTYGKTNAFQCGVYALCIECYTDDQKQTKLSTCISCENDEYFDPQQVQCIKCIDYSQYCLKCAYDLYMSNSPKCLQCIPNRGLDDGQFLDVNCDCEQIDNYLWDQNEICIYNQGGKGNSSVQNGQDVVSCLKCVSESFIIQEYAFDSKIKICTCPGQKVPYKYKGVYHCIECEELNLYLNQSNSFYLDQDSYDICANQNSCTTDVCFSCDQQNPQCKSCTIYDEQYYCTNCKNGGIEPHCTYCKSDEYYDVFEDYCLLSIPSEFYSKQGNKFDGCLDQNVDKLCKSCTVINKYCIGCTDKVINQYSDFLCKSCAENRIPPNCQCPNEMAPSQSNIKLCINCPYGTYYEKENDRCQNDQISLDCKFEDICLKCSEYIHPWCLECKSIESQLRCLNCDGDLETYNDPEGRVSCQCPEDTFQFDEKSNECQKCPQFAVCPGGAILLVEKGYWRENIQSYEIIPCSNNPNSCNGGSEELTCKEGYKGALCQQCDLNGEIWGAKYGNNSPYTCVKCNEFQQFFTFTFISVTAILLVFYMVYSQVKEVEQQQKKDFVNQIFKLRTGEVLDKSRIYYKILQQYFAQAVVIMDLGVNMGSFTESSFQVLGNPIKQVTYSTDCLIIGIFGNSMPPLYSKALFLNLTFVVYVVSSTILISYFKLKKYQQNNKITYYNRKLQNLEEYKSDDFYQTGLTLSQIIIMVLVFLYINMQQSYIQMFIETISCEKISSYSYTLADSSLKCSSNEYNLYTTYFTGPLLCIWSFIIPFLIFLKVRKASKMPKFKNNKHLKIHKIQEQNLFDQVSTENQFENNYQNQNKQYDSEEEGKNRDDSQTNKFQYQNNDNNQIETESQQKEQNIILNSQENQEKEQQIQLIVNENDNLKKKDGEISFDEYIGFADKEREEDKQNGNDKGQNFLGNLDISDKYNDQDIKDMFFYPDNKKCFLYHRIFQFQFGFIYMEYEDRVYFWDIVKIVQKTLLIIVVSLYNSEVYVKGSMGFLIIILYAFLVKVHQPFKEKNINNLELQGTITISISLILMLFIYQNNFSYLQVIGGIVLTVINIYFVGKIVYLLVLPVIVNEDKMENETDNRVNQSNKINDVSVNIIEDLDQSQIENTDIDNQYFTENTFQSNINSQILSSETKQISQLKKDKYKLKKKKRTHKNQQEDYQVREVIQNLKGKKFKKKNVKQAEEIQNNLEQIQGIYEDEKNENILLDSNLLIFEKTMFNLFFLVMVKVKMFKQQSSINILKNGILNMQFNDFDYMIKNFVDNGILIQNNSNKKQLIQYVNVEYQFLCQQYCEILFFCQENQFKHYFYFFNPLSQVNEHYNCMLVFEQQGKIKSIDIVNSRQLGEDDDCEYDKGQVYNPYYKNNDYNGIKNKKCMDFIDIIVDISDCNQMIFVIRQKQKNSGNLDDPEIYRICTKCSSQDCACSVGKYLNMYDVSEDTAWCQPCPSQCQTCFQDFLYTKEVMCKTCSGTDTSRVPPFCYCQPGYYLSSNTCVADNTICNNPNQYYVDGEIAPNQCQSCTSAFQSQGNVYFEQYCESCYLINQDQSKGVGCYKCYGDLQFPNCTCDDLQFPVQVGTTFECTSCDLNESYFDKEEYEKCIQTGNCLKETVCQSCTSIHEDCLVCENHKFVSGKKNKKEEEEKYEYLCVVCDNYKIEPFCLSCSEILGPGYFYDINYDSCALDQNYTTIIYDDCISEERNQKLPMCVPCNERINEFCDECTSIYVPDAVSQCTSCAGNRVPPDCQCNLKMVPDPNDQKTCILCSSDYYYDSDINTCKYDQNGQAYDCDYSNVCQPCSSIYPYCINCEKEQNDINQNDRLVCLECSGDLQVRPDYGQTPVICWCPVGFYRYDNSTSSCLDCPEHATCLGEFVTSIDAGYWRKDGKSDQIYECLNNKESCQGGSGDFTCQEGYTGALCQTCDYHGTQWDKKYGNSSEYTCSPCSLILSSLKFTAFVAFIVILTLYIMNSQIKERKSNIQKDVLFKIFKKRKSKVHNDARIYYKILFQYLSQTAVLTDLNINLTSFISSIMVNFGNPAKIFSYSIDCFVEPLFGEKFVFQYAKILFLTIVIIILYWLIVLILTIWKSKKCSTKIKTITFRAPQDPAEEFIPDWQYKDGMYIGQLCIMVFIFLFLQFQQSFISIVINSITCVEFSGLSYTKLDLTYQCDQKSYKYYIGLLSIPVFVIVSIFIPLLLFYQLWKASTMTTGGVKIKKVQLQTQIDAQYTTKKQSQDQQTIQNEVQIQDLNAENSLIQQNNQSIISQKSIQDSQYFDDNESENQNNDIDHKKDDKIQKNTKKVNKIISQDQLVYNYFTYFEKQRNQFTTYLENSDFYYKYGFLYQEVTLILKKIGLQQQ